MCRFVMNSFEDIVVGNVFRRHEFLHINGIISNKDQFILPVHLVANLLKSLDKFSYGNSIMCFVIQNDTRTSNRCKKNILLLKLNEF